jgi:hypothetical protein
MKKTETEIYFGDPKEKIESLTLLSRYTGKTVAELETLIAENKKRKFFIVNDEIFSIRTKTIDSNQKDGKSRSRTRLKMTDIVEIDKDKEIEPHKFSAKYFLNGEPSTTHIIADKLGCSSGYMSKVCTRKESLTINGEKIKIIRILKNATFYNVDGKENINTVELSKIVGKSVNWIYKNIKNDKLLELKGHTIACQDRYIHEI